jgi:nitroreductase
MSSTAAAPLDPTALKVRHPDHPIEPQFLARWSPRAFRNEAIGVDELMTLLEAARWAASSGNNQPWRFVYALNGSEAWPRLLGLLNETNQSWAKDASALVFFVSYRLMKAKTGDGMVEAPTHAYDTGTASGYFTLQASLRGWHAHGMAGLDHARAPEVLNVPGDHVVHAAYAVGRLGDPAALPEALRNRETPSDRRPLTQTAFEGAFS